MTDEYKNECRCFIVSFRLTAEQAARIDEAARTLKKPRTRSDYCRATALHQSRQQVPQPVPPLRRPARRLPALDTQQLSRILGQLGKIGGNLNQLAKNANTNSLLPEIKILNEIKASVVAAKAAILSTLNRGCDDGD